MPTDVLTPALSDLKPKAETQDLTYRKIRDLVYQTCGIYHSEEKLYLLSSACKRRIAQLPNALTNAREYLDFLMSPTRRESEIRELLNEITIGETCMFRSQAQLNALHSVILPELVAERSKIGLKRLKVWSAGCSTGEEPYTLAMFLMEESDKLLKDWKVEIQATDLNDRSIETARAGIYGGYALRNTPELFKRKYFLASDDGKLKVRDELKSRISFSRLNLHDDGAGLVTQVAGPSATSSTQQDGYASGSLLSFTIGSDGIIQGIFSNGQPSPLGQIALASFSNEQGLIRNGSNEFLASLASGAANVGQPNTGGRGSISGGALEQSNADIATQFAQLILAERDYQANAKAVTTFDEVTQTAINLKQ